MNIYSDLLLRFQHEIRQGRGADECHHNHVM